MNAEKLGTNFVDRFIQFDTDPLTYSQAANLKMLQVDSDENV